MGFKKALLGWAIEIEDKKPEVKNSEPSKEEKVAEEDLTSLIEPAGSPPTQSTPTDPQAGIVDSQIEEDLLGALEEANLDGYDYFEFCQSLAGMAKVIPIESNRFQAAYAAVSSLVTAEKLIETARHYNDVLNGKSTAFTDYVNQMMEQEVGSREQKVAECDSEIQEKQACIDQLNFEIGELQKQKSELTSEAIQEKAKIEQGQANFNATYSKMVNRINADINKIQTYLMPKDEVKQ